MVRSLKLPVRFEYLQEKESESGPGNEVDTQCTVDLSGRCVGEGRCDSRAGDEDGRERQPEASEGRECYGTEKKGRRR